MNTQIPALATPLNSNKHAKILNARRSVTYHPSVWGDYFIAYDSKVTDISIHEEQEHQRLKEEVKNMLEAMPDDSLHKLDIIDAIQRLEVGYHFETEVKKSVKHINEYHQSLGKQESDLRTVALRFRLLRQQGYNVSCDVFSKFIDREGQFHASLSGNIRGLLSLFEASHFRVHGEETLDKAMEFSINRLRHVSNTSTQVREALEIPIWKTMVRLGARKFLSVYQEDESHNDVLLNFATLDFKLLQKKHQKELFELTRWWKTLEFEKKLPFARDRLLESYTWALGMYFEPQHSIGRKIITKVIHMVSIMDDIFDIYGTLDELTLFMDAIERWDISALDQLPPYLKYYYKVLLDIVYVEIEQDLGKAGKSYLVHYMIEEYKRLARAYFQEAKWEYSDYIPTMEEYMKVGMPSITCKLFTALSLVSVADSVTKEAFEWIASDPRALRATEIISRLMNDLAGFGFEEKVSAVGCYMNQHKGTTKEEAFAAIQEQVTNAWKDINEECLCPTDNMPMAFLKRIFGNIACVAHIMYKDIDDQYTHSRTNLKDVITLMLVQPVTVP